MKATIRKPCRVNLLSGEVEVTAQEFARLQLLGLIESEKAVQNEEKIVKRKKK